MSGDGLDSVVAQLRAHEKRLDVLERRIDELANHLSSVEREVAKLSAELKGMRELFSTEVSVLRDDIKSFEASMDRQSKRNILLMGLILTAVNVVVSLLAALL